ncbi:hypothetical protein DFH28DRAFT_865489, partial [Melampsora americana]
PQTPTKPKPSFIVQPPDLRVDTVCPASVSDPQSDKEPSVYEISSANSKDEDNIELNVNEGSPDQL